MSRRGSFIFAALFCLLELVSPRARATDFSFVRILMDGKPIEEFNDISGEWVERLKSTFYLNLVSQYPYLEKLPPHEFERLIHLDLRSDRVSYIYGSGTAEYVKFIFFLSIDGYSGFASTPSPHVFGGHTMYFGATPTFYAEHPGYRSSPVATLMSLFPRGLVEMPEVLAKMRTWLDEANFTQGIAADRLQVLLKAKHPELVPYLRSAADAPAALSRLELDEATEYAMQELREVRRKLRIAYQALKELNGKVEMSSNELSARRGELTQVTQGLEGQVSQLQRELEEATTARKQLVDGLESIATEFERRILNTQTFLYEVASTIGNEAIVHSGDMRRSADAMVNAELSRSLETIKSLHEAELVGAGVTIHVRPKFLSVVEVQETDPPVVKKRWWWFNQYELPKRTYRSTIAVLIVTEVRGRLGVRTFTNPLHLKYDNTLHTIDLVNDEQLSEHFIDTERALLTMLHDDQYNELKAIMKPSVEQIRQGSLERAKELLGKLIIGPSCALAMGAQADPRALPPSRE